MPVQFKGKVNGKQCIHIKNQRCLKKPQIIGKEIKQSNVLFKHCVSFKIVFLSRVEY